MGEVADMLIDGTLDAYTGEYIGKTCGYPRTLDGSLEWEHSVRSNPMQGISIYIHRNIDKSLKARHVVRKYGELFLNATTHTSNNTIAVTISCEKWKHFKKLPDEQFLTHTTFAPT